MELTTSNIQKIIETGYDLKINEIEKLNLGFDVNTKVFKISTIEQKHYFLKIRLKSFSESCINIPYWLSNNIGLKNVIDPIKTLDNKLYLMNSSSVFMLYPFINGKSGWDVTLTKEHFYKFGKFLYKLHSTEIPEKYINNIYKDEYNYEYVKMVKEYIKKNEKIHNDPIILKFLEALEIYQKEINEIINCLENAVNEISLKNVCICHGDIHAGNLLISENDLFIVDWDTIVLAPKEKDLMYIGGGIGKKWSKDEDINYFYKGYGHKNEVDKKLIKYYRCKRIIQDIYYFIKEILDLNYDNERRNGCLGIFKSFFEPYNVVEMALKEMEII